MFHRILKYATPVVVASLLIGAGVIFHFQAYRDFNSHVLAQRQLAAQRGELPADTREFPRNIALPPGLSQRLSIANMLQQGSMFLIPLVVVVSIVIAREL